MPKTQKNYYSQKCCPATFEGLNQWYKAKFEKLGWMLLAKKYGMMDKVLSYQNSISRLIRAIEQKHKTIHDKDKKADLALMKENAELLLDHVKADFE